MPEKSIGERIRICRETNGYSQAWLANALGINRSTISRYEKGVTEKITISTIEKIAELLGTTKEYLCYGREPIAGGNSKKGDAAGAYLKSPALAYGTIKKESEISEKNLAQICRSGRFVMRVETDALTPRIAPGDLLTVVVSDEVRNKYINVLLMDGKIKMCRLSCENNIVTFMPNNGSMYPEIYKIGELQEKMKIIGYVEKLESGRP